MRTRKELFIFRRGLGLQNNKNGKIIVFGFMFFFSILSVCIFSYLFCLIFDIVIVEMSEICIMSFRHYIEIHQL